MYPAIVATFISSDKRDYEFVLNPLAFGFVHTAPGIFNLAAIKLKIGTYLLILACDPLNNGSGVSYFCVYSNKFMYLFIFRVGRGKV